MPFSRREYDAVVIGGGPNGLSAAITIAEAGRSVLLIEGKETLGGGARSAELTLPGFVHDVCSSVYPHGGVVPVLSRPAARRAWASNGFIPRRRWRTRLDDGSAVILERSRRTDRRESGRGSTSAISVS